MKFFFSIFLSSFSFAFFSFDPFCIFLFKFRFIYITTKRYDFMFE